MTSDDRKRAIGNVISVATDRFVVEMHAGTDNFTVVGFDDVHYVAALGSYLMIPAKTDYVVVEVVGLRERDILTKPQSQAELNKAASAKFLDVVPVGMLPQRLEGKFRFGVSTFPSLYADALYARDDELDRIFETSQISEPAQGPDGELPDPPDATRIGALSIGKSVVFQNYDVKVRIDDFFGGHVAVLGNTGSGKSCTVATVLQSLFEKADEYHARGATFIILDVNGEYNEALRELGGAHGISLTRLLLDGTDAPGRFRLPHWFLDMSEWELLLQASEKTQLPVLRTALGLTSLFRTPGANRVALQDHFVATCIIECYRGADGDSPVTKYQRVLSLLQRYPTQQLNAGILQQFGANAIYGNFSGDGQNKFLAYLRALTFEDVNLPAYENIPFSFEELEDCVDLAILYEEAHGNRQIRDYCSQMVTRLKSLADRREFAFLKHHLPAAGQPMPPQQTQQSFLMRILGLVQSPNGPIKQSQLIIIDMNAVEDEIVELVAAVVTRIAFNVLRRAEPRNRFPVHLLLEEAHRYVASTPSRYALDASKVFERVAKEGRKYGLFLLVASQRPSELSKTVLSQCSNFVIHRIQNPDDLSQIRQMTPFISDSVLRRLPSLPKQHALVFGTAVNLPTTFKVRDADPLPWSNDARIRELWFHEEGRLPELHVWGQPPAEKVAIGGAAAGDAE